MRRSGRPPAAALRRGSAAIGDQVEPALRHRTAEMLARDVVRVDLGNDAGLFGLGAGAEMALEGGPAIAREVAGVGLRHLEMELKAVGGTAQAKGLVDA